MTEKDKLRPYFDKDTTDFLKGFAVVMMFCHHILTYQGWYIDGIFFPEMEPFCTFMAFPTKICVGLFAFLNGYFYAFNNKSRVKYSATRILSLYTVYWMVYIILLIPALKFSSYRPGIGDLVRDILALPNDVVIFGWYVFYFATIMILLPLIKPLLDKNIGVAIGTAFVIVTVLYSVNATFPNAVTDEIIYYYGWWIPVTLAGYIVGRYRIFDRAGEIFSKISSGPVRFCAALCVLILSFFARVFFYHLTFDTGLMGIKITIFICVDVVLIPLFLFALITMRNIVKIPVADGVFREFGKYSMYMWLIHSAFFGISRNIFQKVMFLPYFPVLAFIWALILCYAFARILAIPAGFVNDKIKKMV